MLNVCFDECAFFTMKLGLREESSHSYYALSYGSIKPEMFDRVREKRIHQIYKACSLEERNEMIAEEKQRFNDIIDAAKRDKEIRIWYANNSSDKCGLYHLVHALQGVDCRIFVVEMPSRIGFRDSSWEKAWGEGEPEDFAACLHWARELSREERETMSQKWRKLENENAILRVMLDGEITSVPADYLDDVILSNAPENVDFKAGNMVGYTLGRSVHYITCGYVEWRIEELIKQRRLIVVHRDDDPERWNMMILRRS